MRYKLVDLRIPSRDNATTEAEILVEDGRFAAIAPSVDVVSGDIPVESLGGALVLPGVIDGHVHFDDPGFTHRETFETGTRAAAAGGVTCVVDMPCTSLPPITCAAHLHNKLEVIAPKAHIDYMLWGGVCANSMTPDWRQQLAELVEEGVGAIKIYMLSGMETFRDLGYDEIRQALVETERLGIPTGFHAEDRELVHELTARLRAEAPDEPKSYAASRPAAAEIRAVRAACELCRETGAQVHIVHVGSGEALELVTAARQQGLPISAETCPHFLEFTAEDLDRMGAVLKTAPVVKSAADRERLWQGLVSGEISYVATDHAAGQWPEEKQTGSIWSDYGGVPGVEISLPYLYSEGVAKGRITLQRLVELMASAPARFFGVESRKGQLKVGLDADFVVFGDAETWTVRAAELHNLNRYTPHEGQELTGRVLATYVRGQLAFDRRQGSPSFGAAGSGQWLQRQRH